MSEAMDLLNGLTDEQMALYSGNPSTEPHIVVREDRTIVVPEELKLIAVEGDHNIETVTFDCPRYWDEHDLSNMIIYINYLCPDGYMDAYLADNVRVDESNERLMHFDWTITRNVARAKGNIAFLICAKSTDDEGNENLHWNSLINRDMSVAEGMECVEQIESILPDLITQVLLLNQRTLRCATVWVGSGEMPEGYNIQINPTGHPQIRLRAEDGTIYDLPELQGPKGEDGKTAYQYAKEGGYTDTEANFYNDLAGIQGAADWLANY